MSIQDQLLALAQSLKVGDTIPLGLARGYAAMIERLLATPSVRNALAGLEGRIKTESKNRAVAYHCRLVGLLNGEYGAAQRTAKAWKVAVSSVNQYHSQHGLSIDSELARLRDNIEYAGLSQRQMLQRELDDLTADWLKVE